MSDEKEKTEQNRSEKNLVEQEEEEEASKEERKKSALIDEGDLKTTKDELSQLEAPIKPEYYILHQSSKRRCHMPRTESVNVQARRKLIAASILCLIFIAIEVIGGVLSNSLAIAADAAHTLTDFAGFMISLLAIWLAGRESTDRLTFGWHRAEIIGALASVMSIWFVTAILIWLAVQRCIDRDFEINAVMMMITAAFGFTTNIILAVILRTEMNCDSVESIAGNKKLKHDFGHSHNGSHGWPSRAFKKVEKKFASCWNKLKNRPAKTTSNSTVTKRSTCRNHHPENMNVRAAFIHVLGDGLQSLGVLIAGITIYYRPDWALADPICTFLFALLVLYTTIKILKDILLVLMEGTPTFVDYSEVKAIFENIRGVKSVHGLRIWALSVENVALAVHLVVEKYADARVILNEAEQVIHKHYHLYETTIQIEEDIEHQTEFQDA